jgi:hypothetical protein
MTLVQIGLLLKAANARLAKATPTMDQLEQKLQPLLVKETMDLLL